MKQKRFEELVKAHLTQYKINQLGNLDPGFHKRGECIRSHSHILPREGQLLNLISQDCRDYVREAQMAKKLSLQTCFPHLNSSQAMCMNFFFPLIGNDTLLKAVLNDFLPMETDSDRIVQSVFEYDEKIRIGNIAEGTKFDFFTGFAGGARFYFEIKYCESSCGRAYRGSRNKTDYSGRFFSVYRELFKNSLYFQNASPGIDEFYRHYQLFRNLLYIRKPDDYAVFVYPGKRTDLSNGITEIMNRYSCENAILVTWEELLDSVLRHAKSNQQLVGYYVEFIKKYLPASVSDMENVYNF
jgi:hypothetical protein